LAFFPLTAKERIRKAGGGRKPYGETHPELDVQFMNVLRNHTAGDPMNDTVRWTNLREREIVAALEREYGVQVSRKVVRQLLRKHGYRRRKAQKRQALKREIPDRNAQFEYIAQLRAQYQAAGNPIISMDTKKKEQLGNFYREGHLYTQAELTVYDHDFPSYAEGVIIPHGLYDVGRNIGYLHVGTSHDTSEFACDSLRHWWDTYGRSLYPQATSILVLCDGGGSNSAHYYIFKQDLQALADEIGVEIRIAHYPPYCSKYNPIEHRLFPYVTRACQGVIFTSLEVVVALLAKTHTKTGLRVFVHVLDKVYATGRKVADDFKAQMRIVFDETLPAWNYRAIPASCSIG
jgi:transposase